MQGSVLRWMAAALTGSALLAAVTLAHYGTGAQGTNTALQVTARFSFMLFWLAYAGGGLAVLLDPLGRRAGASSFAQFLRRHGRDFGLSFAAAHLGHISLVGWLCWIGAPPDRDVFVFFVPPFLVVYGLALFSLPSLQRFLGPGLWAVLRTVGMTYIAYAFAVDFLGDPFNPSVKHIIEYAPFAVLSTSGPLLHVVGLVAPFFNTDRVAVVD